MEAVKRTRKNTDWFKPTFNIEKSNPNQSDTSKKRKIVKTTNPKKNEIIEWCDKFTPKDEKELAVNDKTISKVESWLSSTLNHANPHCKILLLTGPSGCGKTACVKILSQKLNAQLSEWITPLDIDYYHENSWNNEVTSYQEKQTDKFCEFLLKASRYASLLSGNDVKRIILVEDFPNIFLKNPKEFENVLQKYNEKGRSPIVFICTDVKNGNLNIHRNLFPNDVISKFNIHQISFNPVTTGQMKLAIKRVVSVIGKDNSTFSIPDPISTDGIINSSMGDIRSALNNLYIVMAKGLTPMTTQSKTIKSDEKSKKKGKVVNKMKKVGKDETVTLLHAIGRVLNPKESEDKKSLTHPPLEIVDQFQSEPNSFLRLLFENYLPHFSNIENIKKASDALSDADCFLNEWRDNHPKLYGLYTAISGLMLANKTPVSHWHPISGSKHHEMKPLSTQDIPHLKNCHLLSSKILATDYKPFCDLITLKTEEPTFESDEEIPIIEEC